MGFSIGRVVYLHRLFGVKTYVCVHVYVHSVYVVCIFIKFWILREKIFKNTLHKREMGVCCCGSLKFFEFLRKMFLERKLNIKEEVDLYKILKFLP